MKNHKKIMKTTKDTGTDKNSREYMVFLYGFFFGGGGLTQVTKAVKDRQEREISDTSIINI